MIKKWKNKIISYNLWQEQSYKMNCMMTKAFEPLYEYYEMLKKKKRIISNHNVFFRKINII